MEINSDFIVTEWKLIKCEKLGSKRENDLYSMLLKETLQLNIDCMYADISWMSVSKVSKVALLVAKK